MEFYNAKLLPNGLHKIIAVFVPHDIYPETKVIAYHRKEMGKSPGSRGYVCYDNLTCSFHIALYPTMCCSSGLSQYPGVPSFQFWMAMLSTALHEVGHLATRQLWVDLPDDTDGRYKNYVEGLANQWRDRALAQILRVDPRLGQPAGALTGYPGVLAYRIRNLGRLRDGSVHIGRIIEWRSLGCGGQVAIADLMSAWCEVYLPYHLSQLNTKSRRRFASVFYGKVHQVAKELSIDRYFVNKSGRRYLMFNAGEAQTVSERLAHGSRHELVRAHWRLSCQGGKSAVPFDTGPKQWQLVGGTSELVAEGPPQIVPPEQLILPLGLGEEHRKTVPAGEHLSWLGWSSS